jgi:hypothetical protein
VKHWACNVTGIDPSTAILVTAFHSEKNIFLGAWRVCHVRSVIYGYVRTSRMILSHIKNACAQEKKNECCNLTTFSTKERKAIDVIPIGGGVKYTMSSGKNTQAIIDHLE